MTISKRKYGWIRDLPDQRDRVFSTYRRLVPLPSSIDLRPKNPSIYDQGPLGSCTANAIGSAFEFDLMKQNLVAFTPSRLFIYFNERVVDGTIETDSGARIRDGIKSVAKQGVCPEIDWPYIITAFRSRPPANCYKEALNHKAIQYRRINHSLESFKEVLAMGFPFVFGFSVYESFEATYITNTGLMAYPKPDERLIGGHAVKAVGYDDTAGHFIIKNSWGTDWGDLGYFYMPYEFMDSNMTSDFWVITVVESSFED